jgi:Kef-type K+ transport system membrane component KefB
MTAAYFLDYITWPVLLLAAWIVAERLHGRFLVPRVSSYVMVGLAAGLLLRPMLYLQEPSYSFLANVALALVLFELGYRINLRWFKHNPWVLAVGVVESCVTFAAVYVVCRWFALPLEVSLVIAALSMSASPGGIVRVANELRGAGQVTERVMHLTAINCLLAILALKLVVGYWHVTAQADWLSAATSSVYGVVVALGLGAAFGVITPRLMRFAGSQGAVAHNATVLFALSVLLLAMLSFAIQVSALLAALSFGVVARERRVQLTQTQRNFGSAGDVLIIFLFMYVAALIQWQHVAGGLLLAAALIAARLLSKVVCNVLVARLSGITWRKGALTGLALTPMSAFAILLLEQSQLRGFEPAAAAFVAMTAMMLLQELFGPWVTQRSLMAAGETHAHSTPGGSHAA